MPRTLKFLAGALALLAALGAARAASDRSETDYAALRGDERVHAELLATSMAYLIDAECPALGLRRLRIVGYALSLSRYAKGLGYSGREVEAYVNDPAEQARFRELAMAGLGALGAEPGNAESYCAVGRAEMQKGTYLGSMLKGG